MTTVVQAFEAMIRDLHLTPEQKAKAQTQRASIIEKLRVDLSIAQDFISGSFGRNTATRPISDVDLVLVLNHDPASGQAPLQVLDVVRDALDNAYPNKEHPILQNRSVGISFSGTGIDYDVVPAFEDGGILRIPDRESNRWIPTDPKAHVKICNNANDAANKKLKPLVKAAKQWNGQREKKAVRSFHLEVMAYDLLRGVTGGYPAGLATLFEGLVSQVRRTCPEPAGLGDPLDADMSPSDREAAAAAFAEAARRARSAIELAEQGKTEHAHWMWRHLLGPIYPERGQKPPEASGVIMAGALGDRTVDPRNLRFG